MKKFKKFAAVFCTALIALTLTACGGGKSKDVTVDTAKLADELLTTVTSDELSKMSVDPVLQQLFHGFGVCCVFAFDDSDFTCSRTGAGVGNRGSDVIRLVKVYGRRIDAHLA